MEKKIVFINQATGYLTIDIINEFVKEYDKVALIAGSIRVQYIPLSNKVECSRIVLYNRGSNFKKLISWIVGSIQILFLLITKYRKYEVFYITVPPLAYLSSLFLPNKFSLLVFDVYPDVLKIYNLAGYGHVYKIWTYLNKKIFARAKKIFTLGQSMKALLSQYIDPTKIIVIPNWTGLTRIEEVARENNRFILDNDLGGKFIVQYSGNIGLTHNIEVLVELAKTMQAYEDILFLIIGRGERVKHIQRIILDYNLSNCKLMPFQPDKLLNHSLSSADIGVIILDDKTPHASIPSKTYNLLAVGVPLLCISSKHSELANLVSNMNNGQCHEKEDLVEMSDFIVRLKNDKALQHTYKLNSRAASKSFTIANARLYLEHLTQKAIVKAKESSI